MTVIRINRRIVRHATERFFLSLSLVATVAGSCIIFPELLDRPWLLAGSEIALFGISLAAYGLLRSVGKSSRTEKTL